MTARQAGMLMVGARNGITNRGRGIVIGAGSIAIVAGSDEIAADHQTAAETGGDSFPTSQMQMQLQFSLC